MGRITTAGLNPLPCIYWYFTIYGADGGTRTRKLRILSPLPIPIRLHPQLLYSGGPTWNRTKTQGIMSTLLYL